MDREPSRQAFAKAYGYLNYNATAKWAALVSGAATGLLYICLLVILWLFVDLAVYRGRIPSFAELPAAQRQEFLARWDEWTPEDRTEALTDRVGLPEATASNLANLPPDQRRQRDLDAIGRVYLYDVLMERVGPAAAQVVSENQPDRGSLADRGILGLVVRSYGRSPLSYLAGWLAWSNPWMWQTAEPGRLHLVAYLTGLLVAAVFIVFLRGVFTFLGEEMAARAVVEASTRLRRAVYHHTYRLGNLTLRSLGPTEAVTIFTRHIEAVHQALFSVLTVQFREPLKFALLLAFALVLHFWLSLAFLLFALLVWLIGGQISAKIRHRTRTATHRASEQLTLIRESLMLMRLVKVYLMELFNQARVERLLASYGQLQMKQCRAAAIGRPLMTFLGVVAGLVLLYAGGLVILNDQLIVPSAITLAATLISLSWPVERWLDSRKLLKRGREGATLIFQFLTRRGDVGQVVGAEFLPPMSRHLEFDNVSLREQGTNRQLLKEVSLKIQAGQKVGLIGEDDLEKHALAYLIPRFLDPTSGEIRIDKYNLRWVTLDSLRAQTVMVLQHNLVFHDTVANNIGCGDPAYGLPQIIEAAKVAHAHHFIQKLPSGYETPIGELGHGLTVSEQFRIALARAILRDPALCIIEEPEVALDEETKALLDDTFARVLPGRTAIFLPQRLSTIRSCDRLFLLHKGQLIASGEHRELLANNPLYRHLHYLQFSDVPEQAVAGTGPK